MDLREALTACAVAAAAGGLIGAERQQAQARLGSDFGGIRTFPLVALLGAAGALLRPIVGAWALGALLIAVTALIGISHARAKDEDLGLTSEVAAVLTFVLGAIAATPELLPHTQRYLLVAAIAAIAMALLALKRPLHGFMAQVSADDVYASVKFVLLALVMLPILPNRTYGPLDVLNPFKIGLMIVLVAGISFAGYVAARAYGSRGLLLTGLIGGLVSSTAVTLTFAGRAKENPKLAPLCTVAILIAASTMFARVLVVVGIVDRALLPSVAVPLAAMTVTGATAALIIHRRVKKDEELAKGVPLRNPFELKQAAKFGLLYAAVLFVAKAAQTYAGDQGVLASAVLAGLTDVDAITLSLTELHGAGMSDFTAAAGITLAATTNTLVKAGLALFLGGKALGRPVGGGLLAALGVGAIALGASAFLW